jgi:hypothetical protein
MDFMDDDLMDFRDADLILPFATAAPIPEEDEDIFYNQEEMAGSSSLDSKPDAKPVAKMVSASMQSRRWSDELTRWVDAENHFALPRLAIARKRREQ